MLSYCPDTGLLNNDRMGKDSHLKALEPMILGRSEMGIYIPLPQIIHHFIPTGN